MNTRINNLKLKKYQHDLVVLEKQCKMRGSASSWEHVKPRRSHCSFSCCHGVAIAIVKQGHFIMWQPLFIYFSYVLNMELCMTPSLSTGTMGRWSSGSWVNSRGGGPGFINHHRNSHPITLHDPAH